jgi:hypothetical protein
MSSSSLARRFLFVLVAVVTSAVAASKDLELLSKADAQSMFSSTRDEWKEKINRAVIAGAARHYGADPRAPAIMTETPDGILIVSGLYDRGDSRPSALHVSTVYRPNSAGARMGNDRINELIRVAKKQMLPEYSVIANFDRVGGGLLIDFFITDERQ